MQSHLANGTATGAAGMPRRRRTTPETAGTSAGSPVPQPAALECPYWPLLPIGVTCVKWIPPFQEFEQSDSGLKDTFKKAAGYVVFPNVGKGGFILGGAHGNGHVYEKGKLVGYASLTQVTVGAQVGGQEFSEVIFFETKEALAKFKESQFAMSAQVSAVAAAEGASKNAKYVDGVMVFTKAKQGLMAEASVGGQKFKFEPVGK